MATVNWVSYVKDDDGHWYEIPTANVPRFNKLVETADYNTLLEEYDHYRLSGAPEGADDE